MTELDDDLAEPARAMLRDYEQPTMGSARRKVLQQRVMTASAAAAIPAVGGATAPAAGKTAMGFKLTLLLGGAGVCALAYVLVSMPGDDPERPRAAAPQEAAPVGVARVAAVEPEPKSETPEPALEPPAAKRPPTRVDEPEAEVVSPPKAKTPPAEPTTVESKKDEGSSSAAEEARLLARAQRALREGKHREALRAVDEHARRFPKGKLVEAREAARAVALCKLEPDRRPEIRRTFEKTFGNSAFLRRVTNACAVDSGGM